MKKKPANAANTTQSQFFRCKAQCMNGGRPCSRCPIADDSFWRQQIRQMQEILRRPYSVAFRIDEENGEKFLHLRVYGLEPGKKPGATE